MDVNEVGRVKFSEDSNPTKVCRAVIVVGML